MIKGKKLKVLVVDDSSLVRKMVRDELVADGYEVIEAADGLEALVKAISGRPPDLITMDVEMPKLDGFSSCQRLREPHYSQYFRNSPENRVPVIFITSLDTLADRRRGFTLGAADFITKPFEKGTVLEAVNSILKPEEKLAGLTVLVVDDNNLARKMVVDALVREGLTVLEAVDGQEAFDLICKRMSAIDLLVTDLMMPKMNGTELCAKVRGELGLKDLPVVFLTAVDEQEKILGVYKSGANDYLIKPFVKEELLARIKVHLQATKLNKRLRSSIVELKTLNQMKDELLAVCSHDLRSPLTGILGFTELLMEKDYLEAEDRESLEQVKNSGDFLLSLINDILDLSKVQSQEAELEVEPLSMLDISNISMKAMGHMAKAKEQNLEFVNQTAQHLVMGNSSGLIRTLNNLLSNAIKFTPEGRDIQLILAGEQDENLSISVVDQGIGIPADKIPFLFDKFSKTSRSGTSGEQGTGLGMSIIKEMVEKHGGTLAVTSQEGVGTTFRFTLPRIRPEFLQQDRRRADGSKAPVSKSSIGSLRILVVEDNPVNRMLAKKYLEKAGHTVALAENGIQAIELVVQGGIDFIFMDVHMPEMDGLTACKRIRQANQTLPIVALTGCTTSDELEECLVAGMNDILTKPFKSGSLLAKIEAWY